MQRFSRLRRHVQLVDDVCDLLICDEGHRLRCLAALDKNALKQCLFVSPMVVQIDASTLSCRTGRNASMRVES